MQNLMKVRYLLAHLTAVSRALFCFLKQATALAIVCGIVDLPSVKRHKAVKSG